MQLHSHWKQRRTRIVPSGPGGVVIEFPLNWRAEDIEVRVRRGTDLVDISSWPVVAADQAQIVRDGDVDVVRWTFTVTNMSRAFFVLEVVTDP